ncbi:MAG TPA: YciI family protein [Pyrinomonadaceae bacterium]|nr:YciI family protein [Pyrinomonadaceae bacterium]
MRVMVIIKANADSEAGIMPSEKVLADMGKFNEELVNAGIMLEGEGLHPTSKAKRIMFTEGKRLVTDGPFAETREHIAGYWIWKVNSIDEAVEWAMRIPYDYEEVKSDTEIDIRPIFEADDFGPELTPELRKLEDRIRAKASKLKE